MMHQVRRDISRKNRTKKADMRREIARRSLAQTKADQQVAADHTSHRRPQDSAKERGRRTDLPAGFIGESSDGHAKRRSARAGSSAFVGAVALVATRTSGKLDGKALTHKLRAVFIAELHY